MKEPIPLAAVHEAILDFCAGRSDVCLFGAQALNRYAQVARMTEDVDIMAESPEETARELARYLGDRFQHHMAARVRTVQRAGRILGYRVYQQRSEERGGNRHLADVRVLDVPREHLVVSDGVQYTDAALTMAMKASAAASRSNQAKRLQDSADLARLMIACPDVGLRELEPLWRQLGASPGARNVFEEISSRGGLEAETDEDSFF